MSVFEWSTLASAFVGAALATLGGEAVRSLIRRGQRTTAIRDTDLIEILETIDDLRDDGVTFWSKDAALLGDSFEILKSRIVANQHYLNRTVAKLFTGDAKISCDLAVIHLMKALSGGQFDDPERLASSKNLKGIHLECRKVRALARALRDDMGAPFFS